MLWIDFFKKNKLHFLITGILLVLILCSPFQDYQEGSISPYEMEMNDTDLQVDPDTNYFYIDSSVSSEPVSIISEDIYLQKGSYELTFQITANADGTTVDAYAPGYLNADNTTGLVLASADLPAEAESITLPLTVEADIQHIQLRVHYSGVETLEVRGIDFLSEAGLYKDPYLLCGLVLLLSVILLIYKARHAFDRRIFWGLVFVSLFTSLPLAYNWLFAGHDIFFHYGRMLNLTLGLKEGHFPVRFHPNLFLGFGYTSSIFYSEFFFYIPAFLGTLGMSPIGCYKLLLLGMNFATAFVSYFAFSRLSKSKGIGLFAAALYTLSLYRLMDLYTRAAIGEALAMTFLPLLVLGMYELFLGDSRKWIFASLAFTGLLQSHIITTELSIAFSAFFALTQLKQLRDKTRLKHLFLAAGVTVLLNLWFIIPMLHHMQYPVSIFGEFRDLYEYALYPAQLFDTNVANTTAFALSIGQNSGEMPYSIGFPLLIGSILFFICCYRSKEQTKNMKIGKFLSFLSILSIYATTIYFPWGKIQSFPILDRLTSSLQFPFRFLSIATICLCLVSAFGFYYAFQTANARKLLCIAGTILMVVCSGIYLGSFCESAEEFVYNGNMITKGMKTDTLYIINDTDLLYGYRDYEKRSGILLASDGVSITDTSRPDSYTISFSYTAEGAASYVDLPFNYYPCFRARTDSGEQLPTEIGEMSRLRVQLPDAGEGHITVTYTTPFLYRLGDCVTLLTALGLILLYRYKKSTRKELSHETVEKA